ncbi:beta-lactamase [Nostoc linckia z18]|jgi:beta-lactamase class A|uniref:Beta-lactamase n=3 Tax=Nostoc TaxID=1177 RepID=A0A9Q5Z6Q3_NOSLI|nr:MULTISPECIES: serine hydrolase [Nostoc]MBL1199761.1 serine hydrolase [Nostoc sp. GBBB01]MDZ8015485.1 serine hydrolase [Nostoc sp. ZfuVER08]PHK41482.1 beta-lactamase [Nostoc linckia z15]PHK44178.1 beta-lactamase [Nostoc linckia z16]MBD2611293.1 serine hydrolase [Nostoc punctiforme FACHB-252]
MKLRWFSLSLISLFMLSSPVKANPSSDRSYSVYDWSKNQSNLTLPPLKFVPPVPSDVITPTNKPQFTGIVPLGHEISELKTPINKLVSRYKFLTPGIFFMDLETGDYISVNGNKAFAAASTIKYPILIALFQEVDAGRINLNETLVMQRKYVVGGSGSMQYKRVGSKFSVLKTATMMMTISDNTATNMIIARLGGIPKLNQRFRSWGLQSTALHRMLGDFNGTNKTSAKDLVKLSALMVSNQLLSDKSKSQVLGIMYGCHNRKLLPSGLGSGAKIAHKTGTLRFVLGDAGIIQTPSGKRYLAGIFVKRPNNDLRARDFIRQVSQVVYGYFEQAKVSNLP